MICIALIHITVYTVLMPYQITVAYERASAYVTLVSGTRRVSTDVDRELTLGREG